METDAIRRRGVMKAYSSSVRAAFAPPAAQRGFTLVELLVAVSLGSVVLASLGGGLLLSELKVSATVQRNLSAKDAANRAIDLMRREASFSRFFAQTTTPGGTLDDCAWATPIAFIQRDNAIICYKTVAPTVLPIAYRSAYQGPCVLVRVGPPYNPDGTLDLTATPIVQMLLDGVARTGRFATTQCPSTTAFDVTYGDLSSGSSGGTVPLTRKANVAINLASGVRYSFGVRAPSNPAYDGKDLYAKCTALSPTGCGLAEEASYHFKPKMDSVTELIEGRGSRENIFYFEHPFGEYTLREKPDTGSCTYASCYVERGGFAVKMTNVDALIFADKEIRPST